MTVSTTPDLIDPDAEAATIPLQDIGLVDSDPEPAFDTIADLVVSLLEAPTALVSIVEPEKDRQYFKSLRGLTEPWASRRQTPLTHSFCKHVRELGEPLLVSDAVNDARVRDNLGVAELGIAAYLGVPIHGPDRRPIGALCVIDNKPRDWSADDVETLSKLGELVSDEVMMRAALRLSRRRLEELTREIESRKAMEERLRLLATTDPLTGVMNRRALMDRFAAEIARSRRFGHPLGVMMIDLDHFKAVNDTHGHGVGDDVLRGLADRVGRLVRVGIDTLARYGGEEFC